METKEIDIKKTLSCNSLKHMKSQFKNQKTPLGRGLLSEEEKKEKLERKMSICLVVC